MILAFLFCFVFYKMQQKGLTAIRKIIIAEIWWNAEVFFLIYQKKGNLESGIQNKILYLWAPPWSSEKEEQTNKSWYNAAN